MVQLREDWEGFWFSFDTVISRTHPDREHGMLDLRSEECWINPKSPVSCQLSDMA